MENGIRISQEDITSCCSGRLVVPSALLGDLPRSIRVWRGRNKKYADAGFAGKFSCRVFSRAAKELIDSFDPGVYQFLKIKKTIDGNKNEIETPFYVAVIMSLPQNAIDTEKSPLIWKPIMAGSDQKYWKLATTREEAMGRKMTLMKAAIGERHFWGGSPKLLATVEFCSDVFRDAWERAGLQGFGFIDCDES